MDTARRFSFIANKPVASEPTLIIYRPELVGGNDRLAYLRAFHAASGSRFLEADVEYSSSFSVTSSDSQSISACYAPFADSFAFVTSGGVYAIDNLKRIESQSLANFKRPLGLEDGVDLAVVSDTQSLYFCLLYTSPSPRDRQKSRMPSSA